LIATGLLLIQSRVSPRWLAWISLIGGTLLFSRCSAFGGVIATYGLVLDLIGFMLCLLFVVLSTASMLRDRGVTHPTEAQNARRPAPPPRGLRARRRRRPPGRSRYAKSAPRESRTSRAGSLMSAAAGCQEHTIRRSPAVTATRSTPPSQPWQRTRAGSGRLVTQGTRVPGGGRTTKGIVSIHDRPRVNARAIRRGRVVA
jgi:hypothetical protein